MNETKISRITAILLMICVLILSAAFFMTSKQQFSENENRYLETLPSITWEGIKNGKVTEKINLYLCDHFPFRDFFIGLKSRAEIIAGKGEINSVYIGKDNYLIESYPPPANTEQIAQSLRRFAEHEQVSQRELHLMLVPTAVYIYQDKLPRFAPVNNQMETAEQIYQDSKIPALDCSQILLSHKDKEPLYYRTDHHWTSYGAYLGYLAFCQKKGIVPSPLEAFEEEIVTRDFRGTVYSKVNDYTQKGEPISVFRHPEDRLTVFYKDVNEISHSLYNLDYIEKKDKYSLFLNNLHPLIEITNETADSDRELMLIKDSYANSMVPFLVRHFKTIYVFDTRYYRFGPSGFLEEHQGITDILILYNMSTLDTDLGIRGIF